MKKIGALLVAAGLALAGMFAFWADLAARLPPLEPWRGAVVVVGSALFLLGLALLAMNWIARAWRWFLKKYWGVWVYDCRPATPSDADFIDKLSSDRIGLETSDINAIQRLIGLRVTTVFVLFRSVYLDDVSRKERRGYFIVFPLSKAGIASLKEGTFNARNPNERHLCNPKNSAAVYIGGIAAKARRRCQTRCTSIMQGMLRSSEFAAVEMIYARAGTKRGLDLLKAWKFHPMISSQKGLGALYAKAIK